MTLENDMRRSLHSVSLGTTHLAHTHTIQTTCTGILWIESNQFAESEVSGTMISWSSFPWSPASSACAFPAIRPSSRNSSTSFIMVGYTARTRSCRRQLYCHDMQKLQPDNFQTNWHPKEIPQILVVKNPYPASQAQLSTCWRRILLSPGPEISTRRDVLPCTLGSTAGSTVKALLSVKGR